MLGLHVFGVPVRSSWGLCGSVCSVFNTGYAADATTLANIAWSMSLREWMEQTAANGQYTGHSYVMSGAHSGLGIPTHDNQASILLI